MIEIKEEVTRKLAGETSLRIYSQYSQEIITAIKNNAEQYFYDKHDSSWEIPITSLAKVLDILCCIDDINLYTLESEKSKFVSYEIFTKNKLFKHQEDAVQYGLNHDSWLLLDAPGLGKTLSMITLAENRKRISGIEHCLIVCGINTLKQNWKKEIQKFSDESVMILGERTTKSGNIKIGSVNDRIADLKRPIKEFFVITNIETLRNDDIIKFILKGENKFDMIVLDEIHKVCSPTAQQTKNFMKLSVAKYKIGLTGTLLLNKPWDCHNALKWIGSDRSSFTTFKFYYTVFGGQFNHEVLYYRNLSILKEQLENNSLRRTKDLLQLPEKTIINEFVELNPKQRDFYDSIVNGVVGSLDKVTLNTASILSVIVRLRQSLSCPELLSSEKIESSKIERAYDLVTQFISSGEKVVVFSVFKQPLYNLQLKLSDYNPLLCTGDIGQSDIAKNIDYFQNDDTHMIMLCTTSAMGTGITLTRASVMVFIDCTYTAANNLQCEDRIHRIGSDKPVFIYYLWNSNTVDEKIKQLVDDKSMLGEYIIDDTYSDGVVERLKSIVQDLK